MEAKVREENLTEIERLQKQIGINEHSYWTLEDKLGMIKEMGVNKLEYCGFGETKEDDRQMSMLYFFY